MHYKKLLFATTLILSFSSAQISFLDFKDICQNNQNKSCPNNPKEIAIIQKLLNIGKTNKIKVNGKYDKATQNAIINFQKESNLPPSGFVGLQTKIALEQRFRELKYRAAHKMPLVDKKVAISKKDKNSQTVAKQETSNKKSQKIATNKTNNSKKVANKISDKKIASKKTQNNKKQNSWTNAKTFEEFRKYVDLRKSYRVFKDYSLLKKANAKNTMVKISVKTQRVNLLVNGKVALCAPCTTGSKHKLEPNTKTYRDKHTPYGTFKIMEKIAVKRSTIFGTIYVNGKAVYKGDRRKYKGPKGKFVGHPLKNWMRLTSGGIGLHASKYVKRYPGSNGCVRLPKDVSQIIFSKVSKGTKVVVTN